MQRLWQGATQRGLGNTETGEWRIAAPPPAKSIKQRHKITLLYFPHALFQQATEDVNPKLCCHSISFKVCSLEFEKDAT